MIELQKIFIVWGKNQYAISCSCPAVVVFVVVDLLSHGWCNLLFYLAFVVILNFLVNFFFSFYEIFDVLDFLFENCFELLLIK